MIRAQGFNRETQAAEFLNGTGAARYAEVLRTVRELTGKRLRKLYIRTPPSIGRLPRLI